MVESGSGPEAASLKSEKSKDIRSTNIIAAQAVADVVRTSLGPRGMDKMVSTPHTFTYGTILPESNIVLSGGFKSGNFHFAP